MTHPNFPYNHDAEDLRDYMFDMAQDHFKFNQSEEEVKDVMLKLIKEVKSEWCKEQREDCANKFELFKGTSYEKIIEVILNTPEP